VSQSGHEDMVLSPLGTSATNWPIVPDEWWVVGGMRIDRGTEVLGENLPQCHFVHHKSHMTLTDLLYQMSDEQSVEWELTGEQKYSEKTCPSATLSTINPTWPYLESNLGCRCGKPETNRLSYGTALRNGFSRRFWCDWIYFSLFGDVLPV
jgi:hypothetical protein